MRSTGRVPGPARPGGDLGELQRRVLDMVARSLDTTVPVVDAGGCAGHTRHDECVAEGLRVLLVALPTVIEPWPAGDPVEALGTAALLARVGEALDQVAEASRRASVAFAVVGRELAADIADSLLTVALALRILVEILGRTSTRA